MSARIFFDCETTGLDPRSTVLEAAWTVTGEDGRQRGPLRSRYCQITPGAREAALIPLPRTPDGLPAWAWPMTDDTRMATSMAVESGLYDDWLATPPFSILVRGDELERLILDDIHRYTDLGEVVHIAGGGVAQFDQPRLRTLCPRLVSRPGVDGATHYRPVDQSVTLETLTANASTNTKSLVIAEWLSERQPDEIEPIHLGSRVSCQFRGDILAWLQGKVPHRAGPDVARSVMLHRALWHWGAPLRDRLETISQPEVGT